MEPQIGDIWRWKNRNGEEHLLVLDITSSKRSTTTGFAIDCTFLKLEDGAIFNTTCHYSYWIWTKVA